MTFLTRRILQKSWDCDAHELRLVLRLPRGYRFTAMDVGCCRVYLEYFHVDAPETLLRDAVDLQVPVRGPEAVHALREDCGDEVLNVWVPRQASTALGLDLAARQAQPSTLASWGQAAS